jgi:hypothetical protein
MPPYNEYEPYRVEVHYGSETLGPQGGPGYYTVDNVTHPVVQEVDGSAYARGPFTDTLTGVWNDDFQAALERAVAAGFDRQLTEISTRYLLGRQWLRAENLAPEPEREPAPLASRVRAYDLED